MPPPAGRQAPYVELGITSPFSFLRGASDADRAGASRARARHDAIGIADRNTLAGVVRTHAACKEAGLRPLIGCRLDLTDAPSCSPLPNRREGYGRLSRPAQPGQDGGPKKASASCRCKTSRSICDGIAFIAWPNEDIDGFEAELPRLLRALTSLRHVAASWLYRGDDRRAIEQLDRIARRNGCTIVATNDVHYHRARPPPAAGRRHLHPRESDDRDGGLSAQSQCRAASEVAGEMARLFERWPHAIQRRANSPTRSTSASTSCATNIPGRRCRRAGRRSSISSILTWKARKNAGRTDSRQGLKQLNYELPLIEKLDFARYFLTGPRHRRDSRAGSIRRSCARDAGRRRTAPSAMPRHHRGRPGDQRPPVRALHSRRGAPRAADMRRRLRASSGAEEVIQHIYREVWPRPRLASPRP
jgi:error-prone DNA polymerase